MRISYSIRLSPDLRALALQLMQNLTPHQFPGADGLTADDVLRSYAILASRGCLPDREDLCRLHPELAGEVDELLATAPRG